MKINNYEYRSIDILPSISDSNDDDVMKIEGRAMVFNQPQLLYTDEINNNYYEIIDKDALIDCDLSDVCLKYNHDDGQQILARTRNNSLILQVRDDGLYFTATLPETSFAKDVYTLIKNQILTGVSAGFIVDDDDFNRTTLTRTIKRFKFLKEISIVDNPAYIDTQVSTSTRNYLDAQQELIKKIHEDEQRHNLILLSYL